MARCPCAHCDPRECMCPPVPPAARRSSVLTAPALSSSGALTAFWCVCVRAHVCASVGRDGSLSLSVSLTSLCVLMDGGAGHPS